MAQERGGGAAEFRRLLTPSEIRVPGISALGRASGRQEAFPLLEHIHRGKFEFVLAMAGTQRFQVSGVEYTVYPGQAFIVRPNEPHAGIEQAREPRELLWFQLDPRHEDFLGLPESEADLLRDWLIHFGARQIGLEEWLVEQFAEAFSLLTQEDGARRIQGRALLYCLVELMSTDRMIDVLSPEIDRAKRYILAHPAEQIDPDELLLESGLSQAEFRRRFESQIGMSPREFILRGKIAQAQKDLAAGERDISRIAYGYHFSSVSYFKLKFKEITGKSVKQYLRECEKPRKWKR